MGKIRIQEVILENNAKRYMLIDRNGFPVLPVMKYLKYLDKTGKVLIRKNILLFLKTFLYLFRRKGERLQVHSIRGFS